MLGIQLKDHEDIPTTLQRGDTIGLRLVAGFLIIGAKRNDKALRIGPISEEISIQLVTHIAHDQFPAIDLVVNMLGSLLLFGGIQFHKDIQDPFYATITIA